MTFETSTVVTAPSNIAFLKYWGKEDPSKQWPANDSLSMTLKHSVTETRVSYSKNPYDTFTLDGKTINSQENPHHKIFRHLSLLRDVTKNQRFLAIHSQNSFPTGCGIASSASGFAALTLGGVAQLMGQTSWDALHHVGFSRDRLADLARRGSGSAGRSLWGGYVKWSKGQTPETQVLSPIYDHNHWDLVDVIVVVSSEEKSVSSSEAHLGAWSSPLFKVRLSGIEERQKNLLSALNLKDIEQLGSLIETEALEMHAVTMTGTPSIRYWTKDTELFLEWIRTGRRQGKFAAWFTIDAGPNIHLICEKSASEQLIKHLQKDWPTTKFILDGVGQGPNLSSLDKE